jgi:hypothetical protein
VGLITLTPLRKKAADVNVSNSVSAIDALLINRRFVGLITSFTAGDWVYGQTGGILTNDTVILQNSDALKGLLALKTGDINGSFTPGVASKQTPDIRIHEEGEILVSELQTFELPVYPQQGLQLGAMSVVLFYPESYMEVMDIKSELENFVYNIDRGEIRIAWSSLSPEIFSHERPMFHIRGRLYPGTPNDASFVIEPGIECELNNINGDVLSPQTLNIPKLSKTGSGSAFVIPNEKAFQLGQNYPNPFTKESLIPYYVPETSSVRITLMNLLGEEIAVLYEGQQLQGINYINVDGSKLAPGLYLYRLEAHNDHLTFDKSMTLVVNP